MASKTQRQGISLIELTEMFPDEASAVAWFETKRWREGRYCGHCGSTDTKEAPNARPMPYWCRSCQSYFSVRTGTTIANSKIPLRTWAFAVYIYVTNLKGVSSLRLSQDLGVTQKTAWFMLHRLRKSWDNSGIDEMMAGPAEVDEAYIGGKRKNMHAWKRRQLHGRGGIGKTAIIGIKDRASNRIRARKIEAADRATMQGFIAEHVAPGAKVFTDEAVGYKGMPFDHETVNHSAGDYVRGQAGTQGIEAFWSILKRAHKGTYHYMSPKHLQRYVDELAGRHNVRGLDTIDQMGDVVAAMAGKRLTYRDLVAQSGLAREPG